MRNALHALCMQQETEFLSIHCTASYIRYSGAWLFYIIKTLSAMCFFMFFPDQNSECAGGVQGWMSAFVKISILNNRNTPARPRQNRNKAYFK